MALSETLRLNRSHSLAKVLQAQGRGKDTILAHINPREAAILKAHGGSGKINPKTGLPEFDDSYDPYDASQSSQANQQPIFGGGGSGGSASSDVSAQPAPDISAPPPDTAPAADTSSGGTDFLSALNLGGLFNGSSGGGGGGAPAAAPAPTDASPGLPSGFNEVTTLPAGANAYGVDTGEAAVDNTATPSPTQQPSWGQRLLSSLTAPNTVAKAIGGVGMGLLGEQQSRQAAKQGTAQANQIKNLGAPFTARGNADLAAAQAGSLTPQSAQSYQIAQAKLAQDAVNRGGVGAQQNIAAAENLRQNLLATQTALGLNLVQIGNEYTMKGIQAQMQSDQQVSGATQAFYKALFQTIGSVGGPSGSNSGAAA